MRGRVSVLFACPILLLMSGIAHAQNYLSLAGTVTDVAAAPVTKASIELIGYDRVRQTESAPNGSFAFHRITLGPYQIQVSAPGFKGQTIKLQLQDHEPPLSIVLEVGNQPDQELCGSHASLTYGPVLGSDSQLSGTVHEYMHGQTLHGAEVTIWQDDDLRSARQSHSDASGRFRFANLPPGKYDLRIAKAGYEPLNVKQLIKPMANAVMIHAVVLRQHTMIACQ